MSDLSPNHPKQKLLFFLEQEIDSNMRTLVRDFVTGVGSSQQWLCGPVQFVDQMEETGDASKGDKPIETLGGYLEIYTAQRPWAIPREIDLRLLSEVEALVQSLCAFSLAHKFVFALELDGVFVGMIEDGKMDETLEVGLLGEWRRHYDSAAG
jgi:hypothetical protein